MIIITLTYQTWFFFDMSFFLSPDWCKYKYKNQRKKTQIKLLNEQNTTLAHALCFRFKPMNENMNR